MYPMGRPSYTIRYGSVGSRPSMHGTYVSSTSGYVDPSAYHHRATCGALSQRCISGRSEVLSLSKPNLPGSRPAERASSIPLAPASTGTSRLPRATSSWLRRAGRGRGRGRRWRTPRAKAFRRSVSPAAGRRRRTRVRRPDLRPRRPLQYAFQAAGVVVVLVRDEDAFEVLGAGAERGEGFADARGAGAHAGVHERPAVIVLQQQDVDGVLKRDRIDFVDARRDYLRR